MKPKLLSIRVYFFAPTISRYFLTARQESGPISLFGVRVAHPISNIAENVVELSEW